MRDRGEETETPQRTATYLSMDYDSGGLYIVVAQSEMDEAIYGNGAFSRR